MSTASGSPLTLGDVARTINSTVGFKMSPLEYE